MTDQQSSINSVQPQGNKNEIDLVELFGIFRNNKWLIITIATVFTLFATILAYVSPNLYQATTTLEVQIDTKRIPTNDIMAMALATRDTVIDNEIDIVQSRLIVDKALESLNLGTRYFTSRNKRNEELYKGSPFVANSEFMIPSMQSYTFHLFPMSEDKFRIVVEPSLKKALLNKAESLVKSSSTELIYYDQIHSFGERISTPWFITTIQKIYNLQNSEYTFSVMPNKDMYKFIQESLSVTLTAEMGTLMRLDFEDTVPLRAKEVLDAIANAYIAKDMSSKTEGHKRKLEFIDKQLAGIRKTLTTSASKLENYKTTETGVDLTEKATLTARKLGELEAQLYELDMQSGILENVLEYLNTHQDIKGIGIGSTQATAAVNSIIQKIQDANRVRTGLLVDYTPLHPDVLKATEEINSLKVALKESLGSSVRSIKHRKSTLQNIISKNQKALVSIPKQERQLANLTRNNVVNEKIYSYLLEKRAETAMAETSTTSKTRIIDTPLLPDEPVGPQRLLMIVIGFIIGLVTGMIAAFSRASMDDNIKSVEDIEHHTAIPLYGAVPFLHSQKNIQPYYEALRVIRTNLEFLQNSNKSKLITVTSSIPGEGKSSTVAELGKVMSKANKKVIIIDMDMRRSTLHEKFSITNEIGASTLLTGKNTLEEVIQSTKHENLNIITSGPTPPNASDLLMSNKLETALKTLLEDYDYVLLDSPPIGLVSDAMIIMRMSDINLIVLKAGYSKKDYLKNINRFVNDHNLNAGIVLNGIELGKKFGYGYGYGYKYDQGSSYYTEKKA